MVNRELLRSVKQSLRKKAFAPLTPEAQAAAAGGAPPGAPPMDPAMMGGMPPMPPMDPAMMGGAPPMDPAMMGGMPPMDPAMMGGMPPMPPVDPATGMPIDPATGMPIDPAMLMGGAPPPEEEAPGDEVVKVSMDDLKALVEEVVGAGGKAEPSKRATNAQIMDKLTELEAAITAITGEVPGPAETGAMPPEMAGLPMPPAGPEDISAMLQQTGLPPVQAAALKSPIASLVKTLKESR